MVIADHKCSLHLWLDDEDRILYAESSGSVARTQWDQGWVNINILLGEYVAGFLKIRLTCFSVTSMGKLNISGRRPGVSELIALDIDSPGSDGLFGLRVIKKKGYVGATGNQLPDLVGFDVEIVDSSTLRFWLINQRPPVDKDKNSSTHRKLVQMQRLMYVNLSVGLRR